MDNNALVAALGSDAVAAVHGYRLEVVDEARSRGLTLRSVSTGAGSDPLDVRLVFADGVRSERGDQRVVVHAA